MLKLRNKVARRCKYIPFLWGLGIQAIVVAPGIAGAGIDAGRHVARVDNQWAIIQSVFLVDVEAETFRSARSRMQIVTGKYQDTIEEILFDYFAREPPVLP